MKTPVSACVHSCTDSFKALSGAISSASKTYQNQAVSAALEDHLGRFRVWCGNTGAQQTGNTSLDYRLRESEHAQQGMQRLLRNLDTLLAEAFDIISGACDPQDHVPNEFSSSESELEETQQSPKITKFDQLVFDIGRAVDSLYRVSTELRKGTPKDRYTKSSKIDVSLYEPYDIQFVREKFPAAKDFLVNRLGKAVSKRRQYFRYRELHHTRLSRGLLFGDIDGTEATKPEDESLSEIGTQGGEATAATFIEPSNSGSGQSGLSESHITSTALRQVPSVVSFATEASYAASVGTNGKSRMPSMPLETFGAPFDCPTCYKKVSVYRSFRSEAWEIHVLKDLQPYVCTFDGCSTSGETYESRSQWYNHELQQHRQIWTCFGHCGRQFRYKEEFETHVREHRPNGLSIEQMPLYIDNSASPWDQNDVDFVRCPLCTGEVRSSLFLEKHLGRHLEEIALLSFPSSQCDSAGELDSEDDSERNEGTSSEQLEEVSQEGYDEWYTFYGLGSKNLEGIEGEEIEMQTVLHEIITTEQKHLAQLDIWHQDHHDLMIESTSFHIRRKDDPREAFRSIKNIYDVGRAELLLPFQHRQNEQGPWIIGLGDIFQKWISKAQTHFLSFAASYPAARATIRLALLERTPHADSINRIEDDKRSERLGMEHYLNSPIARLKQCERLIVTALASRGLSSDLEQSNLQDVRFYIRELLRKCNSMISKATAKVNVLGLEADLVWRPDLSPAKLPYLDLFAAGRRLLYRGDLLMTGSGDNRFRWSLVHGILLDNYLLLTKVRPHKGVYDLSGDDKVVHVIHMTAQMKDLSGISTDLPVVKPSEAGLEFPKKAHEDQDSISKADSSDDKLLFPFSLNLGSEIRTFYAPTRQIRKGWVDAVNTVNGSRARQTEKRIPSSNQTAEPYLYG